jgi:S1-C subfamily serine protease
VALIQLVDASGLPTIKIDDSKVSTCDPIVAAGNAGGKGGDPSVVSGVVTALDKSITASDENGDHQETLHELIETNAPIQPGDSGGPLIDTDGEVIGMNTAASAANQFQSVKSVGYAIPIANALEIADQIKAGKESDTVRIGLPGIMGVQLDKDAQAAVVIGAADGLPAEQAGLIAGSTIVTINGTPVDSAAAVSDLLDRAKPGDKVRVDWTDTAGEQHSGTLTLVEGPAD